MNELKKEYAKFLSDFNWSEFITIRGYQPRSRQSLGDSIRRWFATCNSMKVLFFNVEKDPHSDSFHAHMLVLLKEKKFIKQLLDVELSKLKKTFFVNRGTTRDLENASTYTTKCMYEQSEYGFLTPPTEEKVIQMKIDEFRELAYRARMDNFRRAVRNMEEGIMYTDSKWDVEREELNNLIEFLIKSTSVDLMAMEKELLDVVARMKFPVYLDKYNSLPQVHEKYNHIYRIIKLLDVNRDLCLCLLYPPTVHS